jgi:hypothetical protein
METLELKELAICTDCINVVANGELPPDTDQDTDQLIIDGTIGVMYDGESLGFSYKPCDCCNRKLGGDRFKAILAL